MRWLILNRYDPRNTVLYMTTFVDYLKRAGHMVYGPGHDGFEANRPLGDVINYSKCDAVLAVDKRQDWHNGLRRAGLPKAWLMADYFPAKNQVVRYNRVIERDRYDLLLAQTAPEYARLSEDKRRYIPMSVDPDYFQDMRLDRDIDIAAPWNALPKYYPLRPVIRKRLHQGAWTAHTDYVFYRGYVKLLNRSKLFVNSGTVFLNIQSRYTEAAACGCLMLTDDSAPDDFERQGWIDGLNMVIWRGLNDLTDKIEYYLAHEAERVHIAANAQKMVLRRYTHAHTEARIKEALVSLDGSRN